MHFDPSSLKPACLPGPDPFAGTGPTACRAARQRISGFTLIELLVAISILAIVAVLGWRGLDSIVRSREVLTAELEQTRGLQLTFAQLQSDCARTVNPLNYPNLPEGRSSWIEPQRIILIRHVFSDEQAPAMQIVVYRLQNDNLTRFESIATRDLTVLAQLLTQARTPPDNQIEIVMQKHVQSLTFSGYPESSLTGTTAAPNPATANPDPNAANANNNATATNSAATGANGNPLPNANNSGGAIPVQNVNLAKVTTGLQAIMQLQNHENTIQKIFILGGT